MTRPIDVVIGVVIIAWLVGTVLISTPAIHGLLLVAVVLVVIRLLAP